MNLVNSSIVFVLDENSGVEDFLIQQYKDSGIIPRNILPNKQRKNNNVDILPVIDLEGGYNLQFIQNRIILQINYSKPIDLNKESFNDELEKIARNFYLKLETISIIQAGINFKILKVDSNLSKYKISEDLKLTQMKVEKKIFPFVVKVDFIQAFAVDNQEKEGLLVSANFHKEIDKDENVDDIISQRNNCLNRLIEIINDVTS